MNSHTSRRSFIKASAAAVAAAVGGNIAPSASAQETISTSLPDPKDLPTTVLGRTGLRVPRIAIGTGSRFMAITNEDTSDQLLEQALKDGLFFWDTCSSYGNAALGITSEERLGRVAKGRRSQVVISTKVDARDYSGAMQSIERSLNRLQTDYIDILNVHAIESLSDARNIAGKGKVLEALQKMKEQKVARFIGFSGHQNASAMRYVVDNYDFDIMIMALNHNTPGQPFEENPIPAAACKGMGVCVIKAIRPRENNKTLKVEDLIRYSLSLEYVNAAFIGMDSLNVLRSNVRILRNFQPLPPDRMEEMHVALAPFFDRPQDLPWMQAGYRDGFC